MNGLEDIDYRKTGYYPVHIGDIYYNRYTVVRKIGHGHFSTVWLCYDSTTSSHIGLKIQKNAKNYTEAAMDEIEILSKIHKNPNAFKWKGEDNHIITILNHFMLKGPYGRHVCMVFELLGGNLLDLIKFYDFKGVPLETCKLIIKQSLIGLDYIHRICGVIHTDIKPENILLGLNQGQLHKIQFNLIEDHWIPTIEEKIILNKPAGLNASEGPDPKALNPKQLRREKKKKYRQNKKLEKIARRGIIVPPVQEEKILIRLDPELKVKIADFGNACWISKHFSDEIQTLNYRSPEVILGAGYTHLADVWSLGCVLYELITGNYLFDTDAEENPDKEILLQISDTLKQSSFAWALNGKNAYKYLDYDGNVKHTSDIRFSLQETFEKLGIQDEPLQGVVGLLVLMLQPDPNRRGSAQDCLRHPWISNN